MSHPIPQSIPHIEGDPTLWGLKVVGPAERPGQISAVRSGVVVLDGAQLPFAVVAPAS
jgi:hypothetical protein